jgi:hypothetical protein
METMVAGMSRCADDDVFLDGAAEENEEVEELVEPRFRYKVHFYSNFIDFHFYFREFWAI